MINAMNGMYQPNYMMGMQQYPGLQNNNKLAKNMQNVLSQKEINQLMHKETEVRIDPNLVMRDKCSHKSDGSIALTPLPMMGKGYFKCNICGRTFKMIDTDEDVAGIVSGFTNLIDTIQTVGVELPLSFLEEIGKIKTIAETLPDIHKSVMSIWKSNYSTVNNNIRNAGSNSANIYNYMQTPTAQYYNPYMNNMQMGMQTPMQYGMNTMNQVQYPTGMPQINLNNLTNGTPAGGENPFFSSMQQPMNGMGYGNNNMQQQMMQMTPQQQPQVQPQVNQQQQTTAVPNYQGPSAGNGISLDGGSNKEEKAVATKPVQA